MIDEEQNLANILWETSNQNNWDSSLFDWKKAYLSSLISLATYHHFSKYEIRGANRLNIVPCMAYRSIAQAKQYIEAMRVYQSPNLEGNSYTFRFIERKMIVALVAQTPQAIFVALRGTEMEFRAFVFPRLTTRKDWRTNFDARKICYPPRNQDLFHRGFYDAVDSIYDEVMQIVTGMPEEMPIYITGHSLGGAMAAILNARWRDDVLRAKGYQKFSYKPGLIEPVACYVFGMPRYGNTTTIQDLANPYHIYNVKDGVPTLPPRLFGYSDAKMDNEYCLSEQGSSIIPNFKKGSAFFRHTDSKIEFLSVSAHSMERYITNIKSLAYPQPEPKITITKDENGVEWVNILGVKIKRN